MSRPEVERVIETMVEFEHLRIIASAARLSPVDHAWAAHLRKVISGTAFASAESSNTNARDTQFECFIAGVLTRSGYDVAFQEPDLYVRDRSLRFTVAAKRPRTTESIVRNCQKAARQIARQNEPGVIALDLTPALLPGVFATTSDPNDAINAVAESIGHFLSSTLQGLKRAAAGRATAYLFVAHIPGVVQLPAGPQLMSAVYWHIFNMKPEATWLRDMAVRSETGLFGPMSQDEKRATSA